MRLKILLADDNLTFLTSVKNVLGLLSQAQVIAEAHDGVQALEMATRLQPAHGARCKDVVGNNSPFCTKELGCTARRKTRRATG